MFYNLGDSVALYGAEHGETWQTLYQKMRNFVLYVYHEWISFGMKILLKYFVFWQPLSVLDKSVAMATHNAHMRTYYPQIYLLTPKLCLFQVSTF